MSVMSGVLGRSYGAATMAGQEECGGRVNPALECDDDLPVAEARRRFQQNPRQQGHDQESLAALASRTN